jgi:hypothetical protein
MCSVSNELHFLKNAPRYFGFFACVHSEKHCIRVMNRVHSMNGTFYPRYQFGVQNRLPPVSWKTVKKSIKLVQI